MFVFAHCQVETENACTRGPGRGDETPTKEKSFRKKKVGEKRKNEILQNAKQNKKKKLENKKT